MRGNRIRLVALLLLGIALVSAASTYFDVLAHKHTLRSDLVRRTQWFGAGLQPQIEQQFVTGDKVDWAGLLKKLRQHPDEPSLTVLDNAGNVLASDGDTPTWEKQPGTLIKRTLTTGKEASAFLKLPPASAGSGGNAVAGAPDRMWLEDVIPLHAGGRIAGALLMTADAEYIRDEGIDVWQRSFLRIAVIVVLVAVVMFLTVRWFVQQPVTRATEWLRRLRHGEAGMEEGAGEFDYLAPLAKEVTSLAENLAQARVAAETEARLRDKGENVWTADRLAVHARDRLGNGKLFVISNREPYMHVRSKGKTECIVPPSGLVTAIEPILRACDGTWIAHGSGNDDTSYVDEHDRLRVPPDERRYTLRRVWLSAEEENGYYEGFANEGLWPLCHIAHTRPIFRESDWHQYQSVNEKFAEVLLEEIRGTECPVIFVQDYHFALLPRMIKSARPDARVAIFWHIPWPNPESFSICPWQADLVNGLLGADVIGFHLQSHCNNFMNTVDRTLEARTDWEHFSIRRNGHSSSVRPYPISVAWKDAELLKRDDEGVTAGSGGRMAKLQLAESPAKRKEPGLMIQDNGRRTEPSPLHRELRIEGMQVLLGVDRMDYTKGIVERLLAIEQLLEEQPWHREQIVFVQIASPSRTGISTYADLRVQVEETAERINRAFQTTLWKPVILIQRQCNHDEVERYYRAAEVCLVTSLHDGMNLVAKEYVAARSDNDGVLVLSKFAGASQELRDALLVNPYDVAQVRDAIATALKMTPEERRLRMKRMRQQVKEHNVYRWASNILTDVCSVRIEDEVLAAAFNKPQRKRA
jgi:trehalose 6-phosphate synthase